MALIQSDCMVMFNNTQTATLQPPLGQSYLVKQIDVNGGTNNYLKIYINNKTVGYWRVGTALGSHLFTRTTGMPLFNLMRTLYDDKLFSGYPVCQGENLILNLDTGAATNILVYFDIYDASDLSPTKVNGSQNSEYEFIAYGKASTVGSNNIALYDTQDTPLEFPQFPYAAVVPSGYTITLSGIVGTPVSVSSSTASQGQYTQYIRIMRERTILYDPTKNGISFYSSGVSSTASTTVLGGVTPIGGHSSADLKPYYKLETPLTFSAGEELDMYLVTGYVTTNYTITPALTEIGLILHVKQGT
ncbi:MAG: hypothetical protein QW478_15420 [Candidatus Micrarchaeaceae archaeon]